MNHMNLRTGKTAEPGEIEVERVEKTHRRLAGKPICLDRKAAPAELANESEQELISATVGRFVELVENREVGASPPRAERSRPPSGRVALLSAWDVHTVSARAL